MAAAYAFTPTMETQAGSFLAKNPTFDGRGIIVAVLDTGVDPASSGLLSCPDGRPKLLDVVECSGSGDVVMGAPAKCDAKTPLTLTGVSGRSLTLSPSWVNPTGEWRVGVKRAFELYPKPLVQRIKGERSAASAAANTCLLPELMRAQAAQAAANPSPPTGSPAADAAAELTKRVSALKELAGGEDLGPVLDVVCWHDGMHWRAALDVSGTGDMSAAPGFTNYRIARQWGTLGADTLLSYALNIYDEGGVVSIVTDAGAHGTHVSGIVGGYHPGHPELNGVAPGVQFIAVKIGDTRLGSMETGTGLLRGLKAVADSGAHVINMSYGEPTSRCAVGRFMELARVLILERGIIVCASAGNNGPALSTVGAPGGTVSHVIGVGAAVTQAMMTDLYILRKRHAAATASVDAAGSGCIATNDEDALPEVEGDGGDAETGATTVAAAASAARTHSEEAHAFHDRALDTNFTWSSRGPAHDGALGVSICAPGGAITSVPMWSLQLNQLMNGTSMSSPNAAGCVALLLSGCKARGIPTSPAAVKRALEMTAVPLQGGVDVFGTGYGMVQVERAFAHLSLQHEATSARAELEGKAAMKAGEHTDSSSAFPFSTPPAAAVAACTTGGEATPAAQVEVAGPVLEVTVANGGAGAGEPTDRGVYWRDAAQTSTAADVSVTLTPVWGESASVNTSRVAFQSRLALFSTDPRWATCPDRLLLMHGGRSFNIHVDPKSLLPGSVHYAEIRAYEVLSPAVEAAVLARANALQLWDTLLGETTAFSALDTASAAPAGASSSVAPTDVKASAASSQLFAARGVGRVSAALGPLARVPVTVIKPECAPFHQPRGATASAPAIASAAVPRIGSGSGDSSESVYRFNTSTDYDNADGSRNSGRKARHDDAASASSAVLELRAGSIHRRFIQVPLGATWAVISVTRVDDGSIGSRAGSAASLSNSPAMPLLAAGAPLLHRLHTAAAGAGDGSERFFRTHTIRAHATPHSAATSTSAPPPLTTSTSTSTHPAARPQQHAASTSTAASTPSTQHPQQAAAAQGGGYFSAGGSSSGPGGWYQDENGGAEVDGDTQTAAAAAAAVHTVGGSADADAAAAADDAADASHSANGPPRPTFAPAPSTQVEVRPRPTYTPDASPRTIVVHAVQSRRHVSLRHSEAERYLYLRPGESDALCMALTPGETLEVDLGQFWSSLGPTLVTASVEFRGCGADAARVSFSTDEAFAVVTALPQLHDVTVKPLARALRCVTSIAPTTPIPPVKPLSAQRDCLPGATSTSQQYALCLAYSLSMSEASRGVKLSIARLHNVLYESPWDAVLLTVVNEHGRVIATSDTFPESLSLPKGSLRVQLQLRSTDVGRLEALRSSAAAAESGAGVLALLVDRPLGGGSKVDGIAVPVYGSAYDAVTGGASASAKRLRRGMPLRLFIGTPAASSLPKWVKAGDALTGYLLLEDYALSGLVATSAQSPPEGSVGVGTRHPAGIPLRIVLTAATAAAAAAAAGAEAAVKGGSGGSSAAAKSGGSSSGFDKALSDALVDAAVALVGKLPRDSASAPMAPPASASVVSSTAAATATAADGVVSSLSDAPPATVAQSFLKSLRSNSAVAAAPNEVEVTDPLRVTSALLAYAVRAGHPKPLPLLCAVLKSTLAAAISASSSASVAFPTAAAAAGALSTAPSSAAVACAPQSSSSSDDDTASTAALSATPAAPPAATSPPISHADCVDAAADAVFDAVSVTDVSAYFGLRHDDSSIVPGTPASALHASRTEQKAALVDALAAKARVRVSVVPRLVAEGALSMSVPRLMVAEGAKTITEGVVTASAPSAGVAGAAGTATTAATAVSEGSSGGGSAGFSECLSALSAWVAVTADGPHALLALEAAVRGERWASALEMVNKALSGGSSKAEAEKTLCPVRSLAALRVALCTKLKWSHWAARSAEGAAAAFWPGPVAE